MSEITIETFEQAVASYFEPIAREHDWPIVRRGKDANGEDTYEVMSPFFVMKIRFGVGMHSHNIDAVLIPCHRTPESVETDEGGFGVFAIAGYNGVEMRYMPREQTEEGFFEYAKYVAGMAKTFGLPYLLGQKSDSDKVREYWRKKSEEELETIKGYKFPPNVQKRWHLPPPRDTDGNAE